MKIFFKLLIVFFGTISIGVAQSLTVENGAKVIVDGDGSAGTILDVGGDVIYTGQLNLSNDAQLKVAGNFTNNGGSFSEGNSTVEFNGNSAQVIGRATSGTFQETFYNCVINNSSGGVSIDNTKVNLLTVTNILTPTAGTLTTNGKLRIRSSATITARVAYGTGTISGDVRVEKDLGSGFEDWRQLSIPVEFPDLTGKTDWDDFSNRITVFLDGYSNPGHVNTFVWDAADADGVGGNDLANGWRKATNTDTEANAFSIFLSNTNTVHMFGSGSLPDHFEFIGQLRSGDFAHNLEFTRDPSDDTNTTATPLAYGWNFIGNPWAALMDVNVLLNDATNFTSGYKAIHVWDATNTFDNAGQYRAILANGQSKQAYNTLGLPDIASTSQNLYPYQAFWVRATAASQVCNLIGSTMQSTELTGDQFLKKSYETIRLNVFDQDSIWDQLVIYFNEEATRDFDLNGDAYYLPSQNGQVPKFYALEGADKASIVGRFPNVTDSVKVVFGSQKQQSKFNIHANLDELGEDWHVYLRDKLTDKTYKLAHNNSLTFNNFNGLESQRFVVYFSKNESAFDHLVSGEEANVVAYVSNNVLRLESNGISGPVEIRIYDAVGRVLFKQKQELITGEQYDLGFNPTGQLVLLEVVAGSKSFKQKLFY